MELWNITSVRRAFRLALCAAALSLLTVIGSATTADPASAAQKGLNVTMVWGISNADQDREVAAIKDLNARWVRLYIGWNDWEDSAWGWNVDAVHRSFDRAVNQANRAGARVLLTVSGSPSWASGSSNGYATPRDPADFGDFMNQMAERYRGKVDAYEIWNEEDTWRFWPSGPDPAEYVDLLKAGSEGVRAGDPGEPVVFGGLATNDYNFLQDAYAVEPNLGHYFDVMAVHPYPVSPDGVVAPSPKDVSMNGEDRIADTSFSGYREVRKTMIANGDAKPIWFTEFGWSTTDELQMHGGVDAQTQADYLTRAYRFIKDDPYVKVAFWYELRNNYWMFDANTWEDQLGLMTTDFTPKPAYQAFKDLP